MSSCLCVCVCVRVCARERQRETERERRLLPRLIYSINHSIWFLFIFRSRTVISAAHWALYALPRRFPSTTEAVQHAALGCSSERRRRAPALLRYFMVPNLYGEIPSDLSLVKSAVCRHAGIWASHTYWFMSTLWARFKWLQAHSSAKLCIIILYNLANGSQGKVCSLSPCMHFLLTKLTGCML